MGLIVKLLAHVRGLNSGTIKATTWPICSAVSAHLVGATVAVSAHLVGATAVVSGLRPLLLP